MWDPRAIIVLVLAASVAVASIVGIVGGAYYGRTLTDVGGDVMIAIFGAIIAIIAGYIARRNGEDASPPPANKEAPPDDDAHPD